ncbi:MAG: Rne/Rng family ribonuclease [Sporomusaceae bacterium]|nr:Rne/Rng family ribonuclease [Sporomusaceae bacterium]
MKQTIVVNVGLEETRMAVLEDGSLSEIVVERVETGHIVGNIYKGRIKNVLPGMQAAFIDIGREKNAFLYVGDIFPRIPSRMGPLADVLTTGQEMMIQIAKDALGAKGPRATTHLTLPGRYVVLMPTVDYIGISRRIDSGAERERLRELAEKVRPPGMGVIVRTVAEGRSEEDLAKDLRYLHTLWSSIIARSKLAKAPAALYRDVDLVIRVVRDYLSSDLAELVIDNREAYQRVVELLTYHSPELVSRVSCYDGGDVFEHYRLEEQYNQLQARQVWLACGGYLIFDRTEALTVIDVNTGKFVGRTNLEDTVFRTNLEAAAEIARQIRLRDIGGIIIIDFIDMNNEEHKQAVLTALEEGLKKDRTKSNVVGITGLGLVEMTRKKSRQNLDGMLYSPCPCCAGGGRVQSPPTVAINIRRQLRQLARTAAAGRSYIVQAHPQVAEVLAVPADLKRLQQELSVALKIEAVPALHPETYSILAAHE